MLDSFEALFQSLELPPHQREEVFARQHEEFREMNRGVINVDLLFYRSVPSAVKFLEKELSWMARIRTAALALAVKRYRLVHGGALPVSLEELPPETLEAFGRNPFTGKRIQYLS